MWCVPGGGGRIFLYWCLLLKYTQQLSIRLWTVNWFRHRLKTSWWGYSSRGNWCATATARLRIIPISTTTGTFCHCQNIKYVTLKWFYNYFIIGIIDYWYINITCNYYQLCFYFITRMRPNICQRPRQPGKWDFPRSVFDKSKTWIAAVCLHIFSGTLSARRGRLHDIWSPRHTTRVSWQIN